MSKKILKEFRDLDPETIGNNIDEFLDFLDGPAVIYQDGEDQERTRAYITLLHGNESSGFQALFRWLKSGIKPAVNLVLIVPSVEAARTVPRFSHRALPGKRDQNRCFKSPYDIDEQGLLAQEILLTLKECKPEAAIDMHNTSGSSPSFAVATHMDGQHDALTTMFTNRLIITDLRLGALMEISDYLCPTVTIECGGRLDEQAVETAWEGIKEYFCRKEVLAGDRTDFGLELLNNPVRLEIKAGVELVYEEDNNLDYELVLRTDIEHFNSGVTHKGTRIGWVNRKSMDQVFRCDNLAGQSVLDELLVIEDSQLLINQDAKLFMITTNAGIAKSDCLFYAVNGEGDVITVDVD